MRTRAKLALGIVTGGIALGAMLGAAADPEPKRPPAPPWRTAAQEPYLADAGYQLAEAPPQDLSPYRDSYAPSWADEELADREPDYPAWTYSDVADVDDAGLGEAPAETGPAPPDQPLAPEPQIEGALDALY
jgi:hypothetical protein